MTIEKLILYSVCLLTSIVKSQSVNTTVSLVSSMSVQDTAIISSSTSDLSSLSSSVSTSSVSISSASMSSSQPILDDISTSSSVHVLGSISTPTDLSSSTVFQNVPLVTQTILDVNSTTDENEHITTSNPGLFSTDFSFNKWSNTFPGITSHAGTIGFTNQPVEHTSISQSNSTDLENVSSPSFITSLWSDTIHERTSLVMYTEINATQTSSTGIPTLEVLTTDSLTSSSDPIHSSVIENGIQISQVSEVNFSATSSLESSSLPYFDKSSIFNSASSSSFDFPYISTPISGSGFSSSFDLPPMSTPASNHTSTSTVNVSETVLPSLTTNYITGSVYAVANISSTHIQDIVLSSSIELSVRKSSDVTPDVTAVFQSETLASATPSVKSDTSLIPLTQNYNSSRVTNTASSFESIYSSETQVQFSSATVSPSSEYFKDLSSLSSSDILASDSSQSLDFNKTPTLDSTTWTFSTSLISITVPDASNITISSYSPTSNIISRGVTQSASVSPTTTADAPIITSATSQTTPRPTTKPSTPNIETTPTNSTEPPVEMERKTYRLLFTFEGHCERISENEVLQIEFLKAIMDVTKSTTKLILYNLEAERLLCEPLRVYLRAESRGLNISQLSEPLKSKIASLNFVVPIILDTHVLNFTATNLEIVEILPSDSNELEVAESGLEVVDIVIISIASFLFAVLVLMMVIVICRECYVRKRTTTFHLKDVPHVNLKLSEFTLTRIPRPQMFYRENSRRKHGPIPVSKIRKPQTNGHSDTKDKVKVNQDQIRVRMSKHDDGLVVGVTCSAPPSPTNNSSSCSSTPKNGDCSKTSLLKGSNTETSDGVTNPSYSTDEEVNGNTKIVIVEDENEQLL